MYTPETGLMASALGPLPTEEEPVVTTPLATRSMSPCASIFALPSTVTWVSRTPTARERANLGLPPTVSAVMLVSE